MGTGRCTSKSVTARGVKIHFGTHALWAKPHTDARTWVKITHQSEFRDTPTTQLCVTTRDEHPNTAPRLKFFPIERHGRTTNPEHVLAARLATGKATLPQVRHHLDELADVNPKAAAMHPLTSPRTLQKIFSACTADLGQTTVFADEETALAVASHYNASPELLEQIADVAVATLDAATARREAVYTILSSVYENPSTPDTVLEAEMVTNPSTWHPSLADSSVPAVLANPGLGGRLLSRAISALTNDPEKLVAAYPTLLRHPNATPETLNQGLQAVADAGFARRWAVETAAAFGGRGWADKARSPEVTGTQEPILNELHTNLMAAMAPGVPAATQIGAIDRIGFRAHTAVIALWPDIAPETLAHVISSGDDRIERELATHPRLPVPSLRRLAAMGKYGPRSVLRNPRLPQRDRELVFSATGFTAPEASEAVQGSSDPKFLAAFVDNAEQTGHVNAACVVAQRKPETPPTHRRIDDETYGWVTDILAYPKLTTTQRTRAITMASTWDASVQDLLDYVQVAA